MLPWLLMVLVGCGTENPAPAGPTTAGLDSSATALPADSALAACIRAAAVARGVALDSAGLAGLTELEASGRGILSLEGLGVLRGLQVLDLSNNRIAELAPLAALSRLQALDLALNRITAITALASLRELKGLDLSGNQVVDLTPLSGLTRLETLFLAQNQVQDAAPLLGLPSLKEVDLTVNPLTAEARNTEVAVLSQRGVKLRLSSASSVTSAGRCLAYSDGVGLFLLSYPGGTPVQIGTFPKGFNGLCWSPDGRQLAVAACLDGDILPRIYLMNPDGTEVQPLTQQKPRRGQYSPAWSPAGDCLAYTDYGATSTLRQVFLADLGYGTQTMLSLSSPAGADPVAWSPMGDAFAWAIAGGRLQVYELTYGEEHLIPGSYLTVSSPSWSPGERAIVFAAQALGEPIMGIYLWRASSDKAARLASDPADLANYFGPAWSPRGDQVAYLTKQGLLRQERSELRLHQMDGNTEQVIDLALRWPRALSWSPDGTVLAVAATVAGTTRETVYAVDPASGSIRDLLPASSSRIAALAWAPQ